MKYLFERLVQHAPGPAGRSEFDLKRAVRENVQRLVANRVTSAPTGTPDVLSCGLPSVVDLARDSRPALDVYGRYVRQLVEHYEPRLSHVQTDIEAVDGASPYRLVLCGNLVTENGVEELRFPVSLPVSA